METPRRIIAFLTSECNGSCDHCFLPGVSGVKDRWMNKKNILSIFKTLNKSAQPVLTGGEPFLRNDLKEIIDKLMRIRLVQSIDLLTNGSFPDKIESLCDEICKVHKKPFCLQLSLDGLAKTHDSIRKIPDGFNKVLDTCERVKRISSLYRKFSFIIHITVMRQNIPEIVELIDYLEERGYPSRLSLVRGNSFSTFGVPEDILNTGYNPQRDVIFDTKKVEDLLKRISEKHPSYFNSFQKQKFRVMLNTLYLKKRQVPCYAGYEDAVVYSGGDIAICEQVKPFGNLSEWNWDLLKAWNSEKAMEHRRKLSSCSCIHSCNIATSACMRPDAPIPKYPVKLPGSFWGLATFFNPAGYKNKLKNYRRFRKNTKRQGLNLLTVEVAFNNADFELKKSDADILLQIRTESGVLWQKERLLNIGLRHLPRDCDKIAWVDTDIIFYNDNWIEKTSNLLESYVIVQPYSFGIGLPRGTYSINPEGLPLGNMEGQKIHGMAYGIANFGKKTLGDYLKHGHTGYAWAGRRNVFDKHGFYDRLILVTGDKFMGYAFYGSKNSKMQMPYSEKMIADQDKWIDKIYKDVKGSVYYTEGTVLHLWHGQYRDRLYWYTKRLLKKYDFDPERDIKLNKQGLWKWATYKPELKNRIREYFDMRKEE